MPPLLHRVGASAARKSRDLYVACVAGALLRDDYLAAIRAAGFAKVELLTDHTYHLSESCTDPLTGVAGKALDGLAASITVLARKPA